ncbi:PLP-dependent aminotransferase family protein [Salinisphaera sp.]|uniref:aminotransferase-like domain-containing protein n=1 Tax=Salinisphaera sp. TaxID=1914330 RepID=UPI002600E6A6|nr:PLP-dependent aminotransferase family protein [Salinisphaera sp.]
MWVPVLSGEGPRYRQVADAIVAAIGTGELAEAEKLPPQRRLAHALGVTTGTITRAYAEVERRGFVQARVGSGTYVCAAVADTFTHVRAQADAGQVDLSLSLPPPCALRAQGLGRAMAALQNDVSALTHAMDYQPEGGLAMHRRVYARWLTQLGLPMAADELLIDQGGMNGIFLSLSTLLAPGERLAAEMLTYPGLISVAQQLGIRTVAVEHDDQGIDIDALVMRHERQPFAALYVMPEHQNPTTAALSESRRQALVALARERDFWLIEDGVQYIRERATPLYQLAPERTVYLFSVAKMFGGGMRSGVIRVPAALSARMAAALRNQSWMPPPLIASLVCRWIESGDADRLLAWQCEEMAARHALVETYLAGYDYSGRTDGFYIWLRLPAGRRANGFVDELAESGIRVTPAEPFCVGSEPAPQAVRICISAAADREALQRALATIRERLDSPGPAVWRTL